MLQIFHSTVYNDTLVVKGLRKQHNLRNVLEHSGQKLFKNHAVTVARPFKTTIYNTQNIQSDATGLTKSPNEWNDLNQVIQIKETDLLPACNDERQWVNREWKIRNWNPDTNSTCEDKHNGQPNEFVKRRNNFHDLPFIISLPAFYFPYFRSPH